MEALQGKKTYLVALAVIVVGAAQTYGVIDAQTAELAWYVVTGGAVVAARSAYAKGS